MPIFKKKQEPKEKDIIAQVRVSKVGQKLVTVPKNTPIEDGDYVRIIKLENPQ